MFSAAFRYVLFKRTKRAQAARFRAPLDNKFRYKELQVIPTLASNGIGACMLRLSISITESQAGRKR